LNILQIHHNDCTGGSAIQAYLISKGLAEKGHQVTFLTRRSDRWEEIKREGDFDVEFAEIKGSLDLKTVSVIRRIVREKGIDIIHVHKGRGLSLALIASLFLKVGGVVVHRTVNFPLDPLNSIKYRLKRLDRVIAVSNAIKGTLIESGHLPHNKISVVHRGVNLDKFHPDGEHNLNIRSELKIPPNSRIVGSVANMYRYKGHDDLIEAADIIIKSHPDTTFLFVGSFGDREYYESLKKRISELGLEKSIIFTGFRQDVPDLINIFDVGVLASTSEGFPGVILQKMAMGKPVVATNIGGIPEIIDDGLNGFLVPPNEPKSLADKIAYLLDNKDKAKEMGAMGRKKVVEEFADFKQIEHIEKVYQDILGLV